MSLVMRLKKCLLTEVHLNEINIQKYRIDTYDIIKLYRGSGKAFWFQTLCLVNGQNLKKEYDPEGEDYLIEKAVSLIESGRMNYFKKVAIPNRLKKQLSQLKEK